MEPLFPISKNPETDNNPKTLFPSFQSFPVQDKTLTRNATSLDWLENKSFPVQQLTSEASSASVEESPLYPDVPCYDRNSQVLEEKAVKKHVYSSSEEDEYYKERKKKKKDKHKHKKKKHKSEKEKGVSPYKVDVLDNERIKSAYGNKVFIDEMHDLEAKNAFRIDRKSNAENWNYQSLYKGHIAKFYDTFQTCMGHKDGEHLYLKEKVEKDVKKEKKRYYSKENARVANRIPMERIYTEDTKDNQAVLPEKMLLPQDPVAEVSITDTDVREKLLDADTKLYVEGKGSIKEEINDKEMSADVLASHRKVEEFNRKLREDPHNVALWLEFLKYQDQRSDLAMNKSKGKEEGKISKLALHEKKVAIMKKAIESNQGNVELKLKYLELCQETWEPHQISKEIEDMLFVQPTNLSLWQHYLLFHQSHLSTFSVTRMSKLYQKCLRTLSKYTRDKVHTVVSTGNVPQKMLMILCQYLNFLKQTGLSERAVATFQALVEFNLFCPCKYKGESLDNRIALFESFWDSNVPRVGEDGAKGWSFYADHKIVEPTQKTDDEVNLSNEQEVIDEKLSKQQTWLKIEQLRSLNHWLPWRPDISKDETEEDCEDMDRLVIFDDISTFLVDIPESLCVDLIFNFLHIIGVGNNKHVTSDLMSQCFIEDLSSFSQEKQVTFSLGNFSRNSSVVESFVTAVCQQTGGVLNSEHKTKLTLLVLNYKFDKIIDSMKKTSAIKSIKAMFKTVLKEPDNRENVDIWMRYAQLLWKRGQNQEAINILEMAISLLGPKKGQTVIQMYRVLAELFLGFTNIEKPISVGRKDKRNDVNSSRALSVLTCLAEEKHQDVKKYEAVSSVAILKCGKKLETFTSELWQKVQDDTGKDGHACTMCYLEYVKCKALFEYSNTSSTIDTALSVFNQALVEIYKFADSHNVSISDLDPNACDKVTGIISKLLSDLFKYKVRLVQHHMNIYSYPLQNLRSVIDAALELFPNDSYFLQAFLDCEKGSHFLGRVDRYFGRSLSRVTSLAPVLYAVMSQLERMTDDQIPNSGALNRVHTYLERGLDSKEIQHCPLLWRLYLQIEMKSKQIKNAQGVFYRAVQHCPWSKAIYMDAVSLFEEDKMEEILDLMTEKELRMQILLEEIDILSS